MVLFLVRCVLYMCIIVMGISNARRLSRQVVTSQSQFQSRSVTLGTNGCNANGKDYKVGEEWTTGRLRYQCSQFGYNIVGCTTSTGKNLKINEDLVSNNTAYRCYRIGNGTRTYFQEFTCGVPGMPSCELKPITSEAENQALGGFRPLNTAPIVVGQLPPGWKILDEQGKPVPIVSGMGSGSTTIVSSSHVAAESGNVGSGVIMGAFPSVSNVGQGLTVIPRTGRSSPNSGNWETARTQSSVSWNGRTRGGYGVGPGTFTIRSGPTGSMSSFAPAQASAGTN